MTQKTNTKSGPPHTDKTFRQSQFKELLWHTLTRQFLLYFLPLLLLAAFFHFEFRQLALESDNAHLEVIAEHQAHILDLFLRERIVNLSNTIDDPLFQQSLDESPPLQEYLAKLRQASSAFVDIAIVSEKGKLIYYQGPISFPQNVDYHDESWFVELLASSKQSVITDIYTGLRNVPHFTIAVKRVIKGEVVILRAALSPGRISEYLASLEGAGEVKASVVSAKGVYQVVTPQFGTPLKRSSYSPPQNPIRGRLEPSAKSNSSNFVAYAWLSEARWVLIVEKRTLGATSSGSTTMLRNALLFTALFFVLMGAIIVLRARQLVKRQMKTDRHKAELSGQLVHAAKLASVGELAAGIAHEINNPLAIIAEEIGVLKDMLDPEFAEEGEEIHLEEHLEIMYEAVFRCRDITRKLLTFVRKSEVRIETHDLHEILDEVLDGMLNNELSISKVESIREYDSDVRSIVTDRNQLIQVILNLVKNAIDAMPNGGRLTVQTSHSNDTAVFSIIDTGSGMSAEQVERVFTPFFTTKDPGKGTGLGLSVSLNVIRSLGGNIFVSSVPERGSVFRVELPYKLVGSKDDKVNNNRKNQDVQ